MKLPSLRWSDQPSLPHDLATVETETLTVWREILQRINVAIMTAQGQVSAYVRGSGRLARQEYADVCDWQRGAKGVLEAVLIDYRRVREEIRQRGVPSRKADRQQTYRDLLLGLVAALEADPNVSDVTRNAAAEFLDFIDCEDDEREGLEGETEP